MSRRNSGAEDAALVLGTLIGYGAVTFGIDSGLAQMALFVLGSFHIVAGFWQAFLLVITLNLIIGWGAAGGVKAAK